MNAKLRPDLRFIENWIPAQSSILDLGCGQGILLSHLQRYKNVHGYGLENDADNITTCIASGVNVLEQDLNNGLGNFADRQFDTVVMSQTLQAVKYPDQLLSEMLRVGKRGIVTFPNFAHWRIRLQLSLTGSMPKSKSLPYDWYDTPNIHLCTFKDFERYCQNVGINILAKHVVDSNYQHSLGLKLLPNWFGEIALYYIS